MTSSLLFFSFFYIRLGYFLFLFFIYDRHFGDLAGAVDFRVGICCFGPDGFNGDERGVSCLFPISQGFFFGFGAYHSVPAFDIRYE